MIVDLTVKFAKENSTWGYDRIQGALAKENIEDQLVGSREVAEAFLYGKAWQIYVRRYLQEEGVQLPDRLFAIRNGLIHGQNVPIDEADIELLESAISALIAVGNRQS